MFRIRAYSTDTWLACFDLAVVACCYVAVMLFELSPAETPRRLLARDHLIGFGLVSVIWFGKLRDAQTSECESLDQTAFSLHSLLRADQFQLGPARFGTTQQRLYFFHR